MGKTFPKVEFDFLNRWKCEPMNQQTNQKNEWINGFYIAKHLLFISASFALFKYCPFLVPLLKSPSNHSPFQCHSFTSIWPFPFLPFPKTNQEIVRNDWHQKKVAAASLCLGPINLLVILPSFHPPKRLPPPFFMPSQKQSLLPYFYSVWPFPFLHRLPSVNFAAALHFLIPPSCPLPSFWANSTLGSVFCHNQILAWLARPNAQLRKEKGGE